MTTALSNSASTYTNDSLSERLAKRAVLATLKKLRHGHLTIHDNGEVYRFGQVEEHTDLAAIIHVHKPSAYRDVALRGTLGSGEAYMDGGWTCSNLLHVIRIFVANMDVMQTMDNKIPFMSKLSNWLMHVATLNSRSGSKRNIAAHYDLSNSLFELMLDNSMMYSSAIYPHAEATLSQAAQHKLKVLCDKLQLKPTDHLLEIGTGWGGLSIYAAQHYGCKVTTTTISQEQYDYAKRRVAEAGLENKIEVLLKDYRELTGRYDKLVSVEMIEAVGHRYYANYFSTCSQLLKPAGLMALQAITISDQRYHQAKNTVDFIQKYIFPGGCLPANHIIAQHVASDTDMEVVNMHDITQDYARTLHDWRQRFFANLDQVKKLGFDNRFVRMWEFYLCYCEGGFLERAIGTYQYVLAKPGYRNIQA